MEPRAVSVERVVHAPADEIFALLADPSNHPRLDGSGTVRAHHHGSPITGVNDQFCMRMRLGLPYRSTSTVVEFEHGRRLAWRPYLYVLGKPVFGGQRWQYVLEVIDDSSTLVRETYVWGDAITPWLLRLGRYPEKTRRTMQQSLEHLEGLLAR